MITTLQKGRVKCLKEETTQKEVFGNLLLIFRKGCTKEDLAEWIKVHNETISKSKAGLIKATKKRKVTFFHLNSEEEIVVKEFHKFNLVIGKTPLFRSKPVKAWFNANLYFSLLGGQSVPLALAIEKKFGLFSLRSYVIYRTPHGFVKLDRYVEDLSNRCKGEQREFLKSLVAFLHTLCKQKLQHKDLKAGNILVKKDGNNWSFLLVDYEDLEARPWSLNFMVRSLWQMCKSLKTIKNFDSFFTYYFLKSLMKPLAPKDRKKLVKSLKRYR